MKTAIARTDNSVLGRWWWSVDHFLLGALFALLGTGIVLAFSATPPVAERLKLETYYLIKHQLVFLMLSVAVMLGISMQSPQTIRRLSCCILAVSFVLLIMVLFCGSEIKGASRWIRIFGISVQPSEIAKPAFAVTAAWLIALGKRQEKFRGTLAASIVFAVLACLLIRQPDFGMTVTVSVIFITELFLSGVSMLVMYILGVCGAIGVISAYFFIPHVQSRIDRFISPETGDTFQVKTAMEAFKNGGLLGRGPGEGTVKNILPDAHTDFVMAVAAEEYGLLICLAITVLFAIIVLRGFYLIFKDKNLFTLLAVSGLLVQFGLQALINIASTLSLIPTKGMTLPFISYGGSSLVSLGFGMGVVLALTRSTNTLKENR